MNDRIGQHLGNYRLIRKLGSGGFAEVYLGEHIYLKTQAAIKVLPMHLALDEMESFYAEARTIASLKHHPHIIPVLEFGVQESTNTPFLVMDYAPNGTLRQRYTKGTKLPLARLLPYIQQTASALQYAHDHKIIHRDVKPENILLSTNNTVLLSDFGLATVAQSTRNQLSEKGVGTIAYSAPEQINGKACYASDQYALAVIVYELLCGTRPFTGSEWEIIAQHLHMPPPPLYEHVPSLLSAVEHIVQKALAKNPKDRFATVRAFALALEEACQREVVEHRTLPISPGSVEQKTLPSSERERLPSLVATPPQHSAVIWNMPHQHNPFFTGRETILSTIYEKLHSGKAVSLIQAISGLGGSGKTQIAIEYAYRYHKDYRVIVWIRGDKRDLLREDCSTIAAQLRFKEKNERVVDAVKSWLKTNTGWLLIFDNIEDLTILRTFVPSTPRGHILLTTRTQTTGTIAQRIELCKMEREEAVLFLLRRIKKLSQESVLSDAAFLDVEKAKEVAELLGDLPLALDQAGAYIEETGCSLADYLVRYRTKRASLLSMRGGLGSDHPASVMATFSHSLEKVEQANPAAAELLRFCAFLDHNAIPEELIRNGADELGAILQPVANDPLALDGAIAVLRKYSLVHRNPDTKMLSLHLLVQAVLKEKMTEATQHEWAERTIKAVNRAFADIEDVQNWASCQHTIPHVLVCNMLIEQWKIVSPEAMRLLYQAAMYFRVQAQYAKAEALLERACTLYDALTKSLSIQPVQTADDIKILFWRHYKRGKYAPLEPLIQQELTYAEKVLGTEDQYVATVRLNLAQLYYKQGRYAAAEQLLLQSLEIKEQYVGLLHSCVACNYHGLGHINLVRGKYSLADLYFQNALTIWESLPEPRHPFMGKTLHGLAELALALGNYTQAESYLKQERVLLEQTLQPLHPTIASSLNTWATLCIAQCRYDQVEILLDQAQTILKQTVGFKHPISARVFHTLARFYIKRGKYVRAEALLQETLGIREQALGNGHLDVAATISNLADVYVARNQHALAEALYKSALEVREKELGIEHSEVAHTLNGLANLYFAQAKYDCAEEYYQHALAIRKTVFGEDHPDVAQTINDLARFYSHRKRLQLAEPFFRSALAIRESRLEPDHLDIADTLKHLAFVLYNVGNKEEAAKMMMRAKRIQVKYAYLDTMDE